MQPRICVTEDPSRPVEQGVDCTLIGPIVALHRRVLKRADNLRVEASKVQWSDDHCSCLKDVGTLVWPRAQVCRRASHVSQAVLCDIELPYAVTRRRSRGPHVRGAASRRIKCGGKVHVDRELAELVDILSHIHVSVDPDDAAQWQAEQIHLVHRPFSTNANDVGAIRWESVPWKNHRMCMIVHMKIGTHEGLILLLDHGEERVVSTHCLKALGDAAHPTDVAAWPSGDISTLWK
mmetsp:Transcript_55400/g.91728  ORF Transcript_55400/g.91728 Transcript_55400/m.91728 type:complete len:235 (-) Transcript_55400:126-830(-)